MSVNSANSTPRPVLLAQGVPLPGTAVDDSDVIRNKGKKEKTPSNTQPTLKPSKTAKPTPTPKVTTSPGASSAPATPTTAPTTPPEVKRDKPSDGVVKEKTTESWLNANSLTAFAVGTAVTVGGILYAKTPSGKMAMSRLRYRNGLNQAANNMGDDWTKSRELMYIQARQGKLGHSGAMDRLYEHTQASYSSGRLSGTPVNGPLTSGTLSPLGSPIAAPSANSAIHSGGLTSGNVVHFDPWTGPTGGNVSGYLPSSGGLNTNSALPAASPDMGVTTGWFNQQKAIAEARVGNGMPRRISTYVQAPTHMPEISAPLPSGATSRSVGQPQASGDISTAFEPTHGNQSGFLPTPAQTASGSGNVAATTASGTLPVTAAPTANIRVKPDNMINRGWARHHNAQNMTKSPEDRRQLLLGMGFSPETIAKIMFK